MTTLATELNLARPDDLYESLIEAHRDLTPQQSDLLNCKLILLLANHVGDPDVLAAAMARARESLAPADDLS